MEQPYTTICQLPLLGAVRLTVHGNCLSRLEFINGMPAATASARNDASPQAALCALAEQQLHEYLTGKRRHFELPLAQQGTQFQCMVWRALCAIPYGQTRSYRQIAEAVGCPHGYRAVGMANKNNPLPLLVPCHRVINADGSLGGFNRGVWRKEILLRLEGGLPI